MAQVPAPGGSGAAWYAIAIRDRGSVTAHVLTAAEWQSDQTSPGPGSATFTNIGAANGYPTQAAAQQAVNTFNALPNAQKLSTAGVNTGSLPNIPNPLGGLAGIGDFFGRLTESSTWIRVAEVVVGLVLLAVGVARITHAVPIATKIAGVAAKGALV